MSTPKKPRADSTLKTLSEERQATIAAHLAEHTLVETCKWLADDGLKTSLRALSEFLCWWRLRSQLQRNGQTVETLLAEFKAAKPDSTPEQVQQVGQAFFSALALAEQDPKAWFLTQQLEFKRQAAELDAAKLALARDAEARAREEFTLARDKFQFDATKAALAKLDSLKAIKAKSNLSEDQKLEQARLELFGSAPK